LLIQAAVGKPTAHDNQKYMEKGKRHMSKENKTAKGESIVWHGKTN
jgi:hypothetical protein